MNRNTTAVPALGLPLLAAVLFAGAAPAQEQADDLPDPGRLPDHPLYFMTSASEAVGSFFTFGDADKAERALELSERRLAEARALAEQGKPEEAERAAERYREQLDRAVARAEEARAEGEDPDGEALEDVSEATSRHQAVLADVYEKVPEQARPGIERAMEASKRGGARAAKAREAASRGGRPDSPGRGPPRGKGPPDSLEADTEDDVERAPPRNRGRPDSVETDSTGDVGRGPPRDRGRPDSAGAVRPDTAGGR